MIAVGFTLQPDEEFLDLVEPLVRADVDYLEVTPETTWRARPGGRIEPNGFHRRFREIGLASHRPFVGHGIGFSLGGAGRADAARRAKWLGRLAEDHAAFGFRWYTEHLGITRLDGLSLTLPLPLPLDAHAARVVSRRLADLRRVVPEVGVENTAQHFVIGDPLDEPALLGRVARAAGSHVLLDLHNLWSMARNLGFDARDWLARLDLSRVIEVHVSGGADSDPAWLPSGRVVRLDGHDGAVPGEVFALLEEVLPRCPRARGVTLERMEGTVRPADVPRLRDELLRIRALTRARRPARVTLPAPIAGPPPRARRGGLPAGDPAVLRAWESLAARALSGPDPVSELDRAARDPATPPPLRSALRAVDRDGVRITALLIARLRFERLLQGSASAAVLFDRDPAGFTATFREYHAETPPADYFPVDEAASFDRWLARAVGEDPGGP